MSTTTEAFEGNAEDREGLLRLLSVSAARGMSLPERMPGGSAADWEFMLRLLSARQDPSSSSVGPRLVGLRRRLKLQELYQKLQPQLREMAHLCEEDRLKEREHKRQERLVLEQAAYERERAMEIEDGRWVMGGWLESMN